MKSYKRYIQTIENFQIRAINPFQEVWVSGNYRFGDIEELDSLEEFVLKELADATPGTVKLKLKKLRRLNNIMVEFDKNYATLYAKSEKDFLRLTDLTVYLPSMDVSDEPELTIKPEFLKTIYQSVLSRRKSLSELINRVEDLL